MDEKQTARKEALARRDALLSEVRAQKSVQVCEGLKNLVSEWFGEDSTDVAKPRHVAVYAAIRSELDLSVFVEAAYARGWDVCFPCMVRDDCGSLDGEPRMVFVPVSRETLRSDPPVFITHPVRSWTMRQLADAGFSVVAPERLDAVAVPLVGFDATGMRLGYGGGNYDRFLPQLRPDALVVGVAFAEQQLARVPTEPHDQPLPRILSA